MSSTCFSGGCCSHCNVELHSLQPNFHFWFFQSPLLILWGVRLQSLQSWTALTAAQLPLLILGGKWVKPGRWHATTCVLLVFQGGSDCNHCKVELHSLQPNFHFWFWGRVGLQSLHSWTALTTDQLPLQWFWGGFQCFQFCIFSIEMKYLMHSLLIKKYFQKQN